MRFRKEYGIVVVLLVLAVTVVGCAGQSADSDNESYIAEIKNWSYENLEQVDNYTKIDTHVILMFDEGGNMLHRGEGHTETIVFYDPYKTKTIALPGTDYPKVPLYELHQNNAITTYYKYIPEDENYYMSKTTKEEYSNPEIFERVYIEEGERKPGLLSGMVDYELLEVSDGQVVIRATINPESLYGENADYTGIELLTQTIYYNKDAQNVEKVELHLIMNMEERLPNFEIDGKTIKEQDETMITEYKDINSSPDFELPEVIEFSN